MPFGVNLMRSPVLDQAANDSLCAYIPEAWAGTVHKSAHRAVPETGAVMLMLDDRLARGMRSSEEPTMAQTSFAAKALV